LIEATILENVGLAFSHETIQLGVIEGARQVIREGISIECMFEVEKTFEGTVTVG
jgi:hypothetical protein